MKTQNKSQSGSTTTSTKGYTFHRYLREAGVLDMPDLPDFTMELTPKPHQLSGLRLAMQKSRFGLFDDAGCVSGDTEFLTPTGWKRIDTYGRGDKVCQFNRDAEEASFCTPIRYIKTTAPYLVSIKGTRGTDQLLSPDHKVLLRTNFANASKPGNKLYWEDMPADKVLSDKPNCNNYRVPIAFSLNLPKGHDFLTTPSLRVMVAVIADGHFPNKSNRVILRLKKQRKITRLRSLLTDAEIPYTERPCLPKGFKTFSFIAPRKEKEFTPEYWSISRRQREAVYAEFPHWDGSAGQGNKGPRFSSCSRKSADFIQFVCASIGVGASLSTCSREGYRDEHSVIVRGSQKPYVMPRAAGITKVAGEAEVYCFTVPDGYLVLRRKGHIFVTGNCGKTLVMQAYALCYVGWGNKVVCTMPPVLCEQFEETLSSNYQGSEEAVSHFILAGAKSKTVNKVRISAERVRLAQFADWSRDGWPDILLMSYEMFYKNTEVLKRAGYNVLVTDEAQKLKGSESDIHAAVYNYTENTDNTALLLATGSPLHHTPVDGYAMSRLLDRESYLSLKSFKRKHCDQKKFYISYQVMRRGVIKNKKRAVYQITGYKNLGQLNKALYKNARRVTKSEVLSLEDPTIITVDLELSGAHKRLYKKLERERMLEIGDRLLTATQAQTLREGLMGIVCSPDNYSTTKVKSVVFNMVDELLDGIGDSSKVLMYAHHNKTLEALADRYEDKKPALVYGGPRSTIKKNLKEVARIKNDDECRIGLLHPKSGGVGLDFQYVCNYIIVVEPTSIQGDFLQLLARIQRMGQEKPVVVYIIRVAGTVYPGMVETMLDNNVRAARVNADSDTFDKWIRSHEMK